MFLAGLLDLCLVVDIAAEWVIRTRLTGEAVVLPTATSTAQTAKADPEIAFSTLLPEPVATLVPIGSTATPRRKSTTATLSSKLKPIRTSTRKLAVQPTLKPPTKTPSPAPTIPGAIALGRQVTVSLPNTLKSAPLTINIPPMPLGCTHAADVPAVVTASITLCAGETYAPILLRGEGIGIFGDQNKSAIIRTQGRTFGIVAEGTGLYIGGVVIRATTDPRDAGIIACKYSECRGVPGPGGTALGGGILIHGSNVVVMNSDASGGVHGIAAENQTQVYLINNRLDGSTGWGSFNWGISDSYFVGNSFSDDNRTCTDPYGSSQVGCEAAGWLCVLCQHNIIANNTCARSGDCYYLPGDANLGSNYNRFHGNQCFGTPHNCFELTFSLGNELVGNSTGPDTASGAACLYPFWVGGSQVVFGPNQWACTITPDKAFRDAEASTDVPTAITLIQPQ